MYLTRAINKLLPLFILLLLAVPQPGWAQYTSTNTIISNDIYLLDGSSDTLWMLTSKGINFTTSITDSPVVWSGFKDLKGWTLTYGSGYTLIRTTPDWSDYFNPGPPAKLWLYDIRDPQKQTFVDLPFNTTALNDTAVFQAADAIWFQGAFWIACMHGGLVKFDITNNIQSIFYPGKNKVGYTAATFTNDTFPSFPDSTHAVSIDADSKILWLACKTKLWGFNPADTTWISTVNSGVAIKEYIDIEARSHGDTSVVYTTIIKAVGDTSLYRYNGFEQRWDEFFNKTPLAVALSDKNHVYLIYKKNNDLHLYLDTLSNTGLPIAYKDDKDFENRINPANENITSYILSDLNYSVINGNTGIFAIATDQGLYYSINEHNDEELNVPFKYEGRSVPISSGLKETYAVPGIINNYNPFTTFAYNLSEDDNVTIDIFDYNMDHVVRIIDDEPRNAGINRTSGRSTVPSQDTWDGTVNNSGGRIVAPGVYFFRVKTKEGKRAFGKVIVAKN